MKVETVMAYSCRILADSHCANRAGEYRLTSYEITLPRMVLAEFNTHTVLSRNSASSRAIPVKKQLRRVLEDPFIPFYWGKNVPGMQAPEPIPEDRVPEAEWAWLRARNKAAISVMELLIGAEPLRRIVTEQSGERPDSFTDAVAEMQDELLLAILEEVIELFEDKSQADHILNVHKQLANRLLEPFMWHTIITTATEWRNFFALRSHNDAQPEIRVIAEMMRDVYGMSLPGDANNDKMRYKPYRDWAEAGYTVSEPLELAADEWHTPLLTREQMNRYGIDWDVACDVSVGRCARVSFLTHEGRENWEEDVALARNRLQPSGHMSPFQHVGRPMRDDELRPITHLYEEDGDMQIGWNGEFDAWSGNFQGFVQYRKTLPHEYDFSEVLALGAA